MSDINELRARAVALGYKTIHKRGNSYRLIDDHGDRCAGGEGLAGMAATLDHMEAFEAGAVQVITTACGAPMSAEDKNGPIELDDPRVIEVLAAKSRTEKQSAPEATKELEWDTVLKPPFTYEALDDELAERLYQQAERIRQRVARTAQDMIDTGLDLAAAKASTEHGTFTSWVDAECGITPRLAQMYMRAAEWVADKSEIISLLQPTAILKLSAKSTPDEIRADVLNRVRAGERVASSQLDIMLCNAREEKKERERLEHMSPKARKKREADKEARAKHNEEWHREEREREERNRSDTHELARLLALYLPADDSAESLGRVIELLKNEDITKGRWHSGVRDPSSLVECLQNRSWDTSVVPTPAKAD